MLKLLFSRQEELEMKIAVTSKGKDIDSEVDPKFGKAAYILIIDTFSLGFEVWNNSENFKESGIQRAAIVNEKGAKALLTGFCGPNAFKALKNAGIQVSNEVSGTVRDAIKAFNEGRISFADNATA